MSYELYRRVVHKVDYQSMSTIYVGRLSTEKNKYLCFENGFHTWQRMCERVSKYSRHGRGHVDIQVEVCIILLEYVWLSLHEHLGGE